MLGLETVVVLGFAVLLCTSLGRRYSVAPPILLLTVGVLLGLVPHLSKVELAPDVVLLLFLPAILYWESMTTSLREIRANLRVIVLNGVVLVFVTAAAVAGVGIALGLDPGAALVLGAVLAPTDATAVAGLARCMPRRTLTTLRAESLINDGTALVLYGLAVGVTTGAQEVTAAGLVGRFVLSYAGGVAVGLLAARLVALVRARLDDPLREGALSVLTPFAAFLAAELVHASGVVAVVVCGLALSQLGPRLIRAHARMQATAFWELTTFMLNAGLFVLVGLQLPRAVRDLDDGLGEAVVFAGAVSLVVIVTRLVWVHTLPYVLRAVDRRPAQRARRVGFRQRTATGWAGFRGAVSLAAALAVPATVQDGSPFPNHDLIVFTTSVVILVTILVQGLTLPLVLRWARLPEDTARGEEIELAHVTANEAGLAALAGQAAAVGAQGVPEDRVRTEFQEHLAAVQTHVETGAQREAERALRLAVLQHKRSAVVGLRDQGRIDDIVLREVQAELDVEEVRLTGVRPTE